MSVNPEVQSIVSVVPEPAELGGPGDAAPEAQVVAASSQVSGYLAYNREPHKARPAWLVPAAIGSAGLIVAGMLGYTLFTTSQTLGAAKHQLGATQASLVSTRGELTAAQADAASRKVVAGYVALYVSDEGKIQTDYFNVVNCANYGECRTAAQQLLTDMQQFQADRAALTVPSALTSSDNSLGDAVSAAIAGDQEFITGLDNNDEGKVKDGGSKVDAAMLNMAKAETALGASLR